MKMDAYDYKKNLVEKYNKNDPIYYTTNNPNALYPKKLDETDCTFPITIVERTKNRIDDKLLDFNEFSTEMIFTPPPGFCIDIRPTNELERRGYAFFPKLINPRECNKILTVNLLKLVDTDDLPLPFPIGLIGILKSANYSHIKKINRSTNIQNEEFVNKNNHQYIQNNIKRNENNTEGFFS